MFNFISTEDFLKDFKKNNPEADITALRKGLLEIGQRKLDGAACAVCGQPIWIVGSVTVGWDACFSCVTDNSNNSNDYEIDLTAENDK